jgi:hypothetical protein
MATKATPNLPAASRMKAPTATNKSLVKAKGSMAKAGKKMMGKKAC